MSSCLQLLNYIRHSQEIYPFLEWKPLPHLSLKPSQFEENNTIVCHECKQIYPFYRDLIAERDFCRFLFSHYKKCHKIQTYLQHALYVAYKGKNAKDFVKIFLPDLEPGVKDSDAVSTSNKDISLLEEYIQKYQKKYAYLKWEPLSTHKQEESEKDKNKKIFCSVCKQVTVPHLRKTVEEYQCDLFVQHSKTCDKLKPLWNQSFHLTGNEQDKKLKLVVENSQGKDFNDPFVRMTRELIFLHLVFMRLTCLFFGDDSEPFSSNRYLTEETKRVWHTNITDNSVAFLLQSGRLGIICEFSKGLKPLLDKFLSIPCRCKKQRHLFHCCTYCDQLPPLWLPFSIWQVVFEYSNSESLIACQSKTCPHHIRHLLDYCKYLIKKISCYSSSRWNNYIQSFKSENAVAAMSKILVKICKETTNESEVAFSLCNAEMGCLCADSLCKFRLSRLFENTILRCLPGYIIPP